MIFVITNRKEKLLLLIGFNNIKEMKSVKVNGPVCFKIYSGTREVCRRCLTCGLFSNSTETSMNRLFCAINDKYIFLNVKPRN